MRRAVRTVTRIARALLFGLMLSGAFGSAATAADHIFVTSDGVHLHYIEQGQGHTIVLVPGWTMPAWIFSRQIDDLSRSYRVVAFDPRSQGDSEIAPSGHEPFRRGRDIQELLAHLGDRSPLLVGWSLGVLDVLSFLHQFGDSAVAGFMLVDNSVGEEPAPVPSRVPPRRRGQRPPSREESMAAFVRGMFSRPHPAAYLDRLTDAALRTPPDIAAELRSYPLPRSFWKEAIYSTSKPVFYLVRPSLAGQAGNLQAHHPNAEALIWRDIGHAMFVDDPAGFDRLLLQFARTRVWR